MPTLAEQAGHNLEQVRKTRPLVHNITNYVVMNFTANVLLALGASPVMAHAREEVEEMTALAGSLVLNIGTLSREWVESMLIAGKRAGELETPIVLDPVGAGATTLRTKTARDILDQTRVSLIRGNASEILALGGQKGGTQGVDSTHQVDDALDVAQDQARNLGTTLALTGVVDLVTDGLRSYRVHNGHHLMTRITGTGCAASACCAAFLAVDRDPVRASSSALAFFGLAGEMAGKQASSPGSFQMALVDALYSMTPDDLATGAKIEGNP